ncbi:hypothetical protein C8R47DRAFT_1324648 [Mycena vitilis]|nr:hypothetical protein C8R47DRAFT_1324648 [Mycena vitilis]
MAQGHSNMRKCVSNEFRCPKVPGPMLPILITGKPKVLTKFSILKLTSSELALFWLKAYVDYARALRPQARYRLSVSAYALRSGDSQTHNILDTIVNVDQLEIQGRYLDYHMHALAYTYTSKVTYTSKFNHGESIGMGPASVGLTDEFNSARPGLDSPGGVIFEL